MRTYGGAIRSAAAYAMNDEFSRILSQQMDHFSNDRNADRLNRLKSEMSQVIKLSTYMFLMDWEKQIIWYWDFFP